MMDDGMKRMTIWAGHQDRGDMKYISDGMGLASESAAIRYAVRRVARQMRDANAKATAAAERRRGAAGGERGDG